MCAAIHGGHMAGQATPMGPESRYTVFNSDQEELSLCVLPRFIPFPSHHQSYVELFYVYSGECSVTMSGETHTLGRGKLLLLNPNVVHGIEKTGSEDIIVQCAIKKQFFDKRMLSPLWQDSFIQRFAGQAFTKRKSVQEYHIFETDDQNDLGYLMESALSEYRTKGICNEDALDSYMNLLFINLSRTYSGVPPERLNHPEQVEVYSIVNHINLNHRTVSLESTAKYFNFNPNYVSRLLKRMTGHSFVEVLKQARMQAAAALLTRTDLPVIEVANEVGYQNVNFFYHVFRQQFHCTPNEYRKQP